MPKLTGIYLFILASRNGPKAWCCHHHASLFHMVVFGWCVVFAPNILFEFRAKNLNLGFIRPWQVFLPALGDFKCVFAKHICKNLRLATRVFKELDIASYNRVCTFLQPHYYISIKYFSLFFSCTGYRSLKVNKVIKGEKIWNDY